MRRENPWTVMDARAFGDESEAIVLLAGTRAECLEAARSGEYGECAVVGPDGLVAFECYGESGWRSEAEQQEQEARDAS